MADDRLVIICRSCRVGKAFAKRLGNWYAVGDCEDKLDTFMRNHQYCGDFDRPWEFAYENDRTPEWQYEE